MKSLQPRANGSAHAINYPINYTYRITYVNKQEKGREKSQPFFTRMPDSYSVPTTTPSNVRDGKLRPCTWYMHGRLV